MTRLSPLGLFGLWCAVLIAATLLSLLAARNDTLPGDRSILNAIQDIPYPADPVSDTLRAITSTEVVLAAGVALAPILWLRGYHQQAGLLIGSLALMVLVQYGLKELVDRPRPDPALVEVRAGHSSPSFPSGHAMSGAVLYAVLAITSSLRLRRPLHRLIFAACVTFLALSGAANVYLGVHWPSDVLGAWLWAAAIGIPVALCYRLMRERSAKS